MGSLTNQYVSQSYQGLVKFENSTGVTGTLQYLEDGLGNDLPLQISNSSVKVTGSLYVSDLQSNTGLTQALVVDTGTGQIYRNTITGGGGSGSAGVLKHDQTNYSTGYLPAGPDLSSVSTLKRYEVKVLLEEGSLNDPEVEAE